MSVQLDEMRTTVTDSVLHVGNQTFGNDKIDRAIRWAGQTFLKETRISRTTGTVTVAQNDTSIDIPATLSDFLPGRLIYPPYIESSHKWLVLVDFTTIRDARDESDTTGRPEMVAFITASKAEIYPQADAQYTVTIPYWQPLTSFTVGTANPDGVSLNIPDGYVDDVAVGAAAYLIRGAPGHPDSEAKMQTFFRAIESAKGEVTDPGVYYVDNGTGQSMTYFLGGWIAVGVAASLAVLCL